MSAKTYIVAVSGGVDSVTLLDMLVKKKLNIEDEAKFVVAHINHGIRVDAGKDQQLVGDLAAGYNLPFETETAQLGIDASEAKARAARYSFLQRCCKKYSSHMIITAHHQDDLLETAILNLLRGTGWRGFAPLTNSKFAGISIIRPLLGFTKDQLLLYAKENGLLWHEDATNLDQKYLRNYIRNSLIPKIIAQDSSFKETMLSYIKQVQKDKKEIATLLQNYILDHCTIENDAYLLPRYDFIMLPSSVATELVYHILVLLDPYWHPQSDLIIKTLEFIKSAQPNKILQVSGNLEVWASKDKVRFQNRVNYVTLT